MIFNRHGLKFENIYLYCKTLEQDKYKYLSEILQPIENIGYYTFNSSHSVLSPEEMKHNSIVIFDDVITESEVNRVSIQSIFTLGRHSLIDILYAVQNYMKLSKHLVRLNCNFLILFRNDITNLKYIYDEMGVNSDMRFDEFKAFCLEVWAEPYGFVCISPEHPKDAGRYRKYFDNYLQL